MDGTASAGTSSDVARIDHIHPHDTAKEDVANKVTSFGSTSTDTQYVSAKAVYDTLHGMIIAQNNVIVDVSAWSADSTLAGYGYKADVTITGMTGNHFAIVTFTENDAISMKYAQENETGDGYVRIYATEIPNGNITISVIAHRQI